MLAVGRSGLTAAAAALVLLPPRQRHFCAAEETGFLHVRASPPPGSPALYPRRWARAPAKAGSGQGATVHLAQFNVLADGLSGKDKKLGGFTDTPPASLDWSYRKGRLIEELLRHDVLPDVIAMEEVDHYHDWFEPVMAELGYEGSFCAKPDSPCKNSWDPSLADGCALFWRRDTMSLVQLETLNYDAMSDDGQPSGRKSNQVAILARMRPRGGAPLAIAVTHLAAKKTSQGERMRAQQLAQLLDRVHTLGLPCIVAADLNAAPEQGTTANYESEAYPMAVRHDLGLRSAYAEALGAEPAYTTWKRRGTGEAMHTIDYIFISPGIQVLRVLAPPEPEDVDADRFPSWRYPSDHVALMAELQVPGGGARL